MARQSYLYQDGMQVSSQCFPLRERTRSIGAQILYMGEFFLFCSTHILKGEHIVHHSKGVEAALVTVNTLKHLTRNQDIIRLSPWMGTKFTILPRLRICLRIGDGLPA